MNVLVVLPTYNEVGEHRPGAPADPGRPWPTPPCWWSTTGAPTGPPTSPRRSGKELGNIEVMRRHAEVGARQRLPGRVPLGARAAASTPASRWTPTCPTSPRRSPAWWRRSAAGCELVVGSRYVPGGVIPNWAWHRRLLSRGGNVYASALLGLGVADSTVRIPGLRRLGAPPHRSRPHPGRGVRVPDRDDLPGQAGRGRRSWRSRSGSWTGWTASRRCPRSSWPRLSAW